KDLNIKAYDTFLSPRELKKAARKIRASYQSLLFLGVDPAEIDRLLGMQDLLIAEVEAAKKVFRNPRDFYDNRRYLAAKSILEDALKLIALPYLHSKLSLGSARMLYSMDLYTMHYSSESTAQILKAVQDPDFNLYLDFYQEYVIPEFIRQAPSLIGISFTFRNQVIPGLTLAYLVKKHLPNAHVVIGGTHFTALRKSLTQNQALFSLFDSAVLYEGEVALVKLADCLERGEPLSSVPNLIYRDDANACPGTRKNKIPQKNFEIHVNPIQRIEHLDQLPAPDFNGLPLELYLSPTLILPVYAARGCYWGKCVFCTFVHTCDGTYYKRGPQNVSADLERLSTQHDCHWFFFVDEAIPPAYMEQIAAGITANGLSLNWFTFARFEKQLDQDLAEKLAASGCRAFCFGLESASSRVLAKMKKGDHPDLMEASLAATTAAGIINQIFFFIGFPTETLTEAKETLKFILDHLELISNLKFSTFMLGINSKIYAAPGEYQIETLLPTPEHDLALGCNYEIKTGLTHEEALETARRFEEVLNELGFPPIMNTILISHYVLFASHYRTGDLRQLTAFPEEQADFETYKTQQLQKARAKAAALFQDPSFLTEEV
ncbi:MAG TPA: radical SAM protein, partial [Bacillota bacterium]|nr:radical SAM protein [Bacillota bacterium]